MGLDTLHPGSISLLLAASAILMAAQKKHTRIKRDLFYGLTSLNSEVVNGTWFSRLLYHYCPVLLFLVLADSLTPGIFRSYQRAIYC